VKAYPEVVYEAKPEPIVQELANTEITPFEKAFDQKEMRIVKIIHKRITEKAKQEKAGKMQGYVDELGTGAKLEMVAIPRGSFTWRGEQEDDVMQVELSSFWMAKLEIDWPLYRPFMEPEINRRKDGHIEFVEQAQHDIDFIARPTAMYHPITHAMPWGEHPATGMTQHAANKFCQWLSMKTGHFYRLPTEAEWEYACRGGKDEDYAWGKQSDKAISYAWYGGSYRTDYQVPGQKLPNGYGLHDMHGNMLEWTIDQYVPNRRAYFGSKFVKDPWIKSLAPYPHVTKGGHWRSKHWSDLAASARHPSQPKWKQMDCQDPKSFWYFTDAPFIGFRVVRPKTIPTPEEMYHYWNSGVEADGDMAAYGDASSLDF